MKIREVMGLPLLVLPFMPVMAAVAIAAPVEVPLKQVTLVQAVTQSADTLYFNPDTAYELPLVVETSVVVNGLTLPEGTVIQGRLEPVAGGLQYIATEVEAGSMRTPFIATSEVLHDVKDPRETGAEAIAGDAAIGAAGGAVIGAVLGDGVSLVEVLGGAAAGVLVGNVTAQRVVILEPDSPVTLMVQ